jgi:hypothetical protein
MLMVTCKGDHGSAAAASSQASFCAGVLLLVLCLGYISPAGFSSVSDDPVGTLPAPCEKGRL